MKRKWVGSYYEEHKEEILAMRAELKKKNRANYLLQNRNKIRNTQKEYRNRRKDYISELKKDWRAEYPEKGREYASRRRARKYGTAVERITPAQLRARAAKFGGGCFYCSCRGTIGPLEHWDHGLPLSRGGSHTLDNLFPSCAACNLSKGAKTVIEFLSIVTR